MKKIFKLVALVAVAVLCFSACQKDGSTGSGKIWYSFGASDINTGSFSDWGKIEAEYKAAFQGINGAKNFERGGTDFQMEGKYKACDEAVIAACKSAESSCASKGLDLTEGYAVLQMTALYSDGNIGQKVVYSKTFGKK